jgi:hypothetical protein
MLWLESEANPRGLGLPSALKAHLPSPSVSAQYRGRRSRPYIFSTHSCDIATRAHPIPPRYPNRTTSRSSLVPVPSGSDFSRTEVSADPFSSRRRVCSETRKIRQKKTVAGRQRR